MKWTIVDLDVWTLNGCNKDDGNNVLYLDISNGNLQKIPDKVFELSNLEYLICSHNYIRKIPPQISKLKSLKSFVCAYNMIFVLPLNIHKLHNLELLDLSNNDLKQLPATIHKLPNLIELICDYNEITEIPENISELPNLRILRCDHNQLCYFPEILKHNLQVCIYNDNNLDKLYNKHKSDGAINFAIKSEMPINTTKIKSDENMYVKKKKVTMVRIPKFESAFDRMLKFNA